MRRFRVGSLWFVLTVPMMVLGHLRCHKLACCTNVAFDVVVLLSFCFSHLAQGSVCPLRSVLRCFICAFVLAVFQHKIKAAVKLECDHPWNFLPTWCVSEAVCVA